MMISFCKKSVHNFLGFSNSKDNETVINFTTHHHHRDFTTTSTAAAGGLGLFTISNNIEKPANVVECSAIKSPPTTASSTPTGNMAKKDPGGIGFLDEVGGSVDGLMSCTESLGFESSDERRVDDHHHHIDQEKSGLFSKSSIWRRKQQVKREVKKFPPPLSSLDHVGRPTIYLHPVRKDGRLELTGVKIARRPEILHAFREDGRLRLRVILDEDDKDIPEEEDDHEEEEKKEIGDETEGDQLRVIEEKEEKERIERWQFPVGSGGGGGGGGDGFRRCNEAGHHHHHRDMNVWRQHCLTIT